MANKKKKKKGIETKDLIQLVTASNSDCGDDNSYNKSDTCT
ncbi:hypothetical protein [Clostridium sp. UBA1056]